MLTPRSRLDAHFGNNHVFNEEAFSATSAYWTDPDITAYQLANSKIAAQVKSRSSNPEYSFTMTTEQFSLGEVAAPIIVFGDEAFQTVPRNLVLYFFRKPPKPKPPPSAPSPSLGLGTRD